VKRMRLASTEFKRSTDWVLQLINIVFLCLLFFLVNGTIAPKEQREIALPRSLFSEAGRPPEDAVYIEKSGGIKFRGKLATVSEIVTVLHHEGSNSILFGNQSTNIEIVADRRLNAAELIDIVTEFRSLDVDTTSLITLREERH
jgi:biopolymer transport protein ExbD